jgi:DNA invertase Pin-like site-specific DNA recombinase
MDDDLGQSGTTAAGRAGLQRLVPAVRRGPVGLILGVEMSRRARSTVDWHRWLQVCARCGPRIADLDDLDGLDDPTHSNGRLLRGRTGPMRDAELPRLTQRM